LLWNGIKCPSRTPPHLTGAPSVCRVHCADILSGLPPPFVCYLDSREAAARRAIRQGVCRFFFPLHAFFRHKIDCFQPRKLLSFSCLIAPPSPFALFIALPAPPVFLLLPIPDTRGQCLFFSRAVANFPPTSSSFLPLPHVVFRSTLAGRHRAFLHKSPCPEGVVGSFFPPLPKRVSLSPLVDTPGVRRSSMGAFPLSRSRVSFLFPDPLPALSPLLCMGTLSGASRSASFLWRIPIP